jgi:hypothetical protein
MQIPLTMSANIAMSSNRVTGLAAAVANGQAVRYEQMFVAGANMLVDSSFEGINVTSNWLPIDATFSASTDVDPRYGLSKTGKLTATGSSQAYVGTNYYTQGIKVGNEYAMSAWARGDGSTTNNWYVQINWYTAASAYIGSNSSTPQALTTTFARSYVVGTAPATAAKAIVYILFSTNTAGKIMYIDGVQLEEGSMPTGYAPKPDEILPETIGSTEIEALSVTSAKIAANAIIAGKINAGAVTAGTIAADAVTSNEILANTITAGDIAANTITAAEIAADAITTSELAADSVTATEIDVATLSAISADLGTITAGTITGAIFQTATSDPRVRMDSTGLFATDASANKVVYLTTSGLDILSSASSTPPDERKIQWKSGSTAITELASYFESNVSYGSFRQFPVTAASDFLINIISTETSSTKLAYLKLESDDTRGFYNLISEGGNASYITTINAYADNTSAYIQVKAGTTFKKLLDASNVSDWAFANDLPWRIDIDPKNQATTHTNFNTLGSVAGNNDHHFGYLISSGAQNALVTFTPVLAAGTWSIYFDTITFTDRGIFTISIDGVSAGTVDTYAAGAATYNVRKSITGISVATTGKKAVEFKMATKNGSSSSYVGLLTAITFIRTA